MFTCIVPSPIYLPVGTMIAGRSDYSGLPDFMRSQGFAKNQDFNHYSKSLSKYIGDNIRVPNATIYKVYSVWNNVLYEYSLIGLVVPTWEDQREQLFPISVKKYDGPHSTYLYIKSIELIANMLNADVSPRYTAMSAQMFFSTMINRCDPNDCYYMEAYKNFHPSFYDQLISEECPQRIGDILIELGQHCLNYSSNAAAYLYFMMGDDLTALNEMFAHGPTDDIISIYGMKGEPLLMNDLLKRTNHSSDTFYKSVAQESISRNSQMFNLIQLDKNAPLYDTFRIEDLLESLYAQPATDFNANITVNKTQYVAKLLMGDVTDRLMINCWEPIREAMNRYNNSNPMSPMIQVNINKTWLDELFISVAYANGGIENYFLNMSLFHLYSPSIIRVPADF